MRCAEPKGTEDRTSLVTRQSDCNRQCDSLYSYSITRYATKTSPARCVQMNSVSGLTGQDERRGQSQRLPRQGAIHRGPSHQSVRAPTTSTAEPPGGTSSECTPISDSSISGAGNAPSAGATSPCISRPFLSRAVARRSTLGAFSTGVVASASGVVLAVVVIATVSGAETLAEEDEVDPSCPTAKVRLLSYCCSGALWFSEATSSTMSPFEMGVTSGVDEASTLLALPSIRFIGLSLLIKLLLVSTSKPVSLVAFRGAGGGGDAGGGATLAASTMASSPFGQKSQARHLHHPQ